MKLYFFRRDNMFGYPEILLYSIRMKVANQTMMEIALICSMKN